MHLRFKLAHVTISPISDRVHSLAQWICAATALLAITVARTADRPNVIFLLANDSAFARLVASKIVIEPTAT